MYKTLSQLLRDSTGTSVIIGRGRKTEEKHGVNNCIKVSRRSLSTSPGVIREGFLEEGVPELGPRVGVVQVERKHGLWDSSSN